MEQWIPEGECRALLRHWFTDRGDPESAALHGARVATLASSLARALGIRDEDWLSSLWLGSAVHDIGKLAVPDSILKKPGRLTMSEWSTVRLHPEWGALLVGRFGMPDSVREMVRHHHEHWNGSGYPDGLRGEEIPLCARVLCVVDVYDALTSDRCYRRALTREQALEVMEREAGTTLDPNIFRVFKESVLGTQLPAEPMLAAS